MVIWKKTTNEALHDEQIHGAAGDPDGASQCPEIPLGVKAFKTPLRLHIL